MQTPLTHKLSLTSFNTERRELPTLENSNLINESSFQILSNFIANCPPQTEEKMDGYGEALPGEGHDALNYGLNGCLMRVNGALRNYQILNNVPLQTFFSYYMYEDGKDSNDEILRNDKEMIDLFKGGIVEYVDWFCCSTETSQSSRSEIRISKLSGDYFHFVQSNAFGIGTRTFETDQYFALHLVDSKETCSTIPLIEFKSFCGIQEGFVHQAKIEDIRKSSKIPSEWSMEKFVRFLMLCSNSLHHNIKEWEQVDTFQTILTGRNVSIITDLQIEQETIMIYREEDDYYEQFSEEERNLVGYNLNHGNLFKEQLSGQSVIEKVLETFRKNENSNELTFLLNLQQTIHNLCVKATFIEKPDNSPVLQRISGQLYNFKNCNSFVIEIGEYVNNYRAHAEAICNVNGKEIPLQLDSSTVNGYTFERFNLRIKNSQQVLIEIIRTPEVSNIEIIDPQFKQDLLGELSQDVTDMEFAGLLYHCLKKTNLYITYSSSFHTSGNKHGYHDVFEENTIFQNRKMFW
ncbi:predicted protein [Naegleria gruberi]|uniref:Predicted protein n=1 Tax=Naegleria gruberi TaxID=5762 RepID=D2VPX6_NAEGR|nr:uncharacterized protein NAEGRDRAFT_51332 [Naegleria gruberi]EFC41201.1 predicted protein [Naegleria gruberi]|eukprot:XP_002673945.1 predicted protein [Naegleria gruberi strain NEG-M]